MSVTSSEIDGSIDLLDMDCSVDFPFRYRQGQPLTHKTHYRINHPMNDHIRLLIHWGLLQVQHHHPTSLTSNVTGRGDTHAAAHHDEETRFFAVFDGQVQRTLG